MDPLSTKFAALADPTRRAILARLALGETNVSELAEPFAMSLPAVSKHLKVLENAGLITRGREAQWRPARLEPKALREVDGWLEQYRAPVGGALRPARRLPQDAAGQGQEQKKARPPSGGEDLLQALRSKPRRSHVAEGIVSI